MKSRPVFVLIFFLILISNPAFATTFISPIAGGTCVISSDFGVRRHPILGTRMGHGAYDFSSQPRGTSLPVQSVAAGVVIAKGYRGDYGHFIEIKHSDGLYTRYTHLRSASSLGVGSSVGAGTRIGSTGRSGRTTGVHLHWEVSTTPGLGGVKIDPVPTYISRSAFGCQEDDEVMPVKAPKPRKRGGVT